MYENINAWTFSTAGTGWHSFDFVEQSETRYIRSQLLNLVLNLVGCTAVPRGTKNRKVLEIPLNLVDLVPKLALCVLPKDHAATGRTSTYISSRSTTQNYVWESTNDPLNSKISALHPVILRPNSTAVGAILRSAVFFQCSCLRSES